MMNNEEFERKMEFIINHHAKLVVGMDELREAHRETEQIVNRLAYVTNVGFKDVNAKIDALVDSQIVTDEKIKGLVDSQIVTDEKIKALVNAQVVTDERFKETDAKIRALADSHKELDASHEQTEEALRKLSDTVDRYIRYRTNNGTG